MASMPKSVHHEGKDWYPFSVNFSDPDGRQFSFTIYAVNREHASYVVQEIRETATLGDQIDSIVRYHYSRHSLSACDNANHPTEEKQWLKSR